MNFEEKIICPDAVKFFSVEQKKTVGKIVFTNGCFDLLHLGHLSYLQKAQQRGDFLLVALNSDESVHRLKGAERPVNYLKTRLAVMASLFFVDAVTWFEEDTPYEIIKQILPDVLVKGGDWKKDQIVGADVVEKNGGEVLSIDYIDGYSTTRLIQKIIDNSSKV